eukprot:2850953-Amphidinium_carterae.1
MRQSQPQPKCMTGQAGSATWAAERVPAGHVSVIAELCADGHVKLPCHLQKMLREGQNRHSSTFNLPFMK